MPPLTGKTWRRVTPASRQHSHDQIIRARANPAKIQVRSFGLNSRLFSRKNAVGTSSAALTPALSHREREIVSSVIRLGDFPQDGQIVLPPPGGEDWREGAITFTP